MSALLEGSYLDDAAFARRFAEDRRNLDGWGSERIERRLAELGRRSRARSAPPSPAAATKAATTSSRRPASCSRAASRSRRTPRATSIGRSASSSARATSSSSRTTRCAATPRPPSRTDAARPGCAVARAWSNDSTPWPLWHRKAEGHGTGATPTRLIEPAPPFPEFPYHPDPRKTGSVVASHARCTVCGHALRPRLRRTGVRRPTTSSTARCAPGASPTARRPPGSASSSPMSATTSRPTSPAACSTRSPSARPDSRAASRSTGSTTAATAPPSSARTEAAGETAYRFRCRHCGVGLAYTDAP